jgi:glutamine synthetase
MTTQTRIPSDRKNAVLADAEKLGIKFISLQFTDIVGVVKNITIPLHKFEDALTYGLWFDGSSIEGFARASTRATCTCCRTWTRSARSPGR